MKPVITKLDDILILDQSIKVVLICCEIGFETGSYSCQFKPKLTLLELSTEVVLCGEPVLELVLELDLEYGRPCQSCDSLKLKKSFCNSIHSMEFTYFYPNTNF